MEHTCISIPDPTGYFATIGFTDCFYQDAYFSYDSNCIVRTFAYDYELPQRKPPYFPSVPLYNHHMLDKHFFGFGLFYHKHIDIHYFTGPCYCKLKEPVNPNITYQEKAQYVMNQFDNIQDYIQQVNIETKRRMFENITRSHMTRQENVHHYNSNTQQGAVASTSRNVQRLEGQNLYTNPQNNPNIAKETQENKMDIPKAYNDIVKHGGNPTGNQQTSRVPQQNINQLTHTNKTSPKDSYKGSMLETKQKHNTSDVKQEDILYKNVNLQNSTKDNGEMKRKKSNAANFPTQSTSTNKQNNTKLHQSSSNMQQDAIASTSTTIQKFEELNLNKNPQNNSKIAKETQEKGIEVVKKVPQQNTNQLTHINKTHSNDSYKSSMSETKQNHNAGALKNENGLNKNVDLQNSTKVNGNMKEKEMIVADIQEKVLEITDRIESLNINDNNTINTEKQAISDKPKYLINNTTTNINNNLCNVADYDSIFEDLKSSIRTIATKLTTVNNSIEKFEQLKDAESYKNLKEKIVDEYTHINQSTRSIINKIRLHKVNQTEFSEKTEREPNKNGTKQKTVDSSHQIKTKPEPKPRPLNKQMSNDISNNHNSKNKNKFIHTNPNQNNQKSDYKENDKNNHKEKSITANHSSVPKQNSFNTGHEQICRDQQSKISKNRKELDTFKEKQEVVDNTNSKFEEDQRMELETSKQVSHDTAEFEKEKCNSNVNNKNIEIKHEENNNPVEKNNNPAAEKINEQPSYYTDNTSNSDVSKTEEDEKRMKIVEAHKKLEKLKVEVKQLTIEVEEFEGSSDDKQFIYLDEMLTRILLKLDNVDTENNKDVRKKRRECIIYAKSTLSELQNKAYVDL